MRGSLSRKEKYQKKIRGFVLPGQIDHKKATIAREVELERMVEGIVGPSLLRGHYMIFAKELNKAMKKHRGENLLTEVEILQDTWSTRGLDTSIMDQIKTWFGIVIAPKYCVFDTGQFDVCLFG